jgi:hypothetical protein
LGSIISPSDYSLNLVLASTTGQLEIRAKYPIKHPHRQLLQLFSRPLAAKLRITPWQQTQQCELRGNFLNLKVSFSQEANVEDDDLRFEL